MYCVAMFYTFTRIRSFGYSTQLLGKLLMEDEKEQDLGSRFASFIFCITRVVKKSTDRISVVVSDICNANRAI